MLGILYWTNQYIKKKTVACHLPKLYCQGNGRKEKEAYFVMRGLKV